MSPPSSYLTSIDRACVYCEPRPLKQWWRSHANAINRWLYTRLMIQSGRASFIVLSSETDPAEISNLLGLDPTSVTNAGTPRSSGRVTDHHTWSVDTGEVDNTSDDQTGTHAVRTLLRLIQPALGKLSNLPPDCEARIQWSAYSDSVQGGFVMPADLAAAIGEFGVDVYGTVYLDDLEDVHTDTSLR